jgi:hypothetical protein
VQFMAEVLGERVSRAQLPPYAVDPEPSGR